MKSLHDQSVDVCERAVAHASGADGTLWNWRFSQAIQKQGWRLVTVVPGLNLGKDAPIYAPQPIPSESFMYPYPSVIAPAWWNV